MMLCIDGSDIARLRLGWSGQGPVARGQGPVARSQSGLSTGNWPLVTIPTGPEGFLAAIDAFVGSESIDGIVVAVGPGSATALRASLAIVNTLAFTKSIPLYGVPSGFDAVDLAELPEPRPYLEPTYSAPAKITESKKDQLQRKVDSSQ